MILFADATTGGYIAGLIVVGLIALACVLAIVLGALLLRDQQDRSLAVGFICTGVIGLLLTGGAWIWASWPPLAYEYHHWIDKKVSVTEVSKRQVSDGDKGFYEKFVVKAPDGGLYGIDDTRAALIKRGDTLTLRCKKAYQFGVPRSAHGWDCRWSG